MSQKPHQPETGPAVMDRPYHDGCPQPRPDWVPDGAGPGFATWVVEGVRTQAVAPRLLQPRRRELSIDEYVEGVLARDRTILARAITLIESNAPVHQARAQALLTRLLPHTGTAMRVGITGIPGAGKSTFIEAFGQHVTGEKHRVAVLAIDPSSSVHGGSILADKLRMERLSRNGDAFIRPSPSGGALGGVGRKTRETILLCEAAGYDVVIVETVGVGQNEVTVRSMVDMFVVLMIAGAGDEMQGIKKGVIEMADALVINKADGENRPRCIAAQAEMKRVLHYLQPSSRGWETPALLASALTGDGIPDVWRTVTDYFRTTKASGDFELRRRTQAVEWMHALLGEELRQRFYTAPGMKEKLAQAESDVAEGRIPVLAATLRILGTEVASDS